MLVGAVLRPHQRKHGQLDVVGLPVEPLEDQLVLVVGEAELAVAAGVRRRVISAGRPAPRFDRVRRHPATVNSATCSRTDSKSFSPSIDPVSGSTACSGWGISPNTLPAWLHTPAMSSWEPFGFCPWA